jgi:hypothetical protein
MNTLSKIKIKDETFEIKDENSRIAINNEVTRAKQAEQELGKRIDNLPTTGGGGEGAIKVVWSNDSAPLSNMNDFTTAGIYELSGEHKRDNDNLPIANTGGGHTFNARLTVLDSSIERTEGEPQSDDKCITQLLNFNNRLGQGEVYIRTGKGRTLDSLTWEKWSTLQRNVNVGQVSKLDDFIDNGIYSGVYFHGSFPHVETFVMIVLNDYAAASQVGKSRSVSQFKYGYDTNTKETTFQHRTLSSDVWSEWEDIGGSYTLPIATRDTLGGIKSATSRPIGSDTEFGRKCDVYVDSNDGLAHIVVAPASTSTLGVVKVDNYVNPESNNPVSGKGVAEYVAKNGGGGDITATPTEEVINNIEETLVTDALRKTPQVLTDTEKEIARGNIGAVSYIDLSSAISNAIVNVLNTEV